MPLGNLKRFDCVVDIFLDVLRGIASQWSILWTNWLQMHVFLFVVDNFGV